MKSLIFSAILSIFILTTACHNKNKTTAPVVNSLGSENSMSDEGANELLAEKQDTATMAMTTEGKEEVEETMEEPIKETKDEKMASVPNPTTKKKDVKKPKTTPTPKKKTTTKSTPSKAKKTPASNSSVTNKAPVTPPPSLTNKSTNNSKNVDKKPTSTSDKNAIIAPTPANLKTDKKEEAKEAPPKANELASFFQSTDKFMRSNVSGGRVGYSSIASNPSALNALAKTIADMDLSGASSTKKQAFYINAYNILVIKSLIDNNLPQGPLKVNGFFDAKQHKVAGKSVTLDKLEKQWLFGLKKDPRFHFVVVCGAIGCPQIESFAYMPSKLNSQLNQQTRKAVNDPNFTKVKDGEKKVLVSEIFKWYKKDFTSTGKSILEYINGYRNNKIPADYSVDYYPYNWDINKK